MPLGDNDIKSELSYAYLHAIAARAGCECRVSGRHSDNQGVDADVICYGTFGPGCLTRVTLLVQLKATSQTLTEQEGRLVYDMDVGQYNKLRTTTSDSPYLLLVMQLPAQPEEWIKWSPRALTMKKCVHWVSLFGAEPSTNTTKQRVFLPKKNHFSVVALKSLLLRAAKEEEIFYDP
jgi:hypothetical protein